PAFRVDPREHDRGGTSRRAPVSRAARAAQEGATLGIATPGQPRADGSASGGSAPEQARVKADRLTPAFPLRVSSIRLCTMAPYLGSVEHPPSPAEAKLCPFPPSHHRTCSFCIKMLSQGSVLSP